MISAGRGFVLVGKFTEGIFFHLVKKSRGDYIHVAKNMGGIMSTYTKNGQGGGGGGGGAGGSFGRDFVRLPIRI